MTLGETIRTALRPVASFATTQFGSTVTVRRSVTERAEDNSEIRGYVTIQGGESVMMLIVDVTHEQAMREWGNDTVVTAAGRISDLVLIQKNDGIIVAAGDYAGQQFRVVDLRPRPIGGLISLGLVTTQETYT